MHNFKTFPKINFHQHIEKTQKNTSRLLRAYSKPEKQRKNAQLKNYINKMNMQIGRNSSRTENLFFSNKLTATNRVGLRCNHHRLFINIYGRVKVVNEESDLSIIEEKQLINW